MARPRKNTRQPSVPVQLGPDGKWHSWIVVGTRPDGSPDRRHREGRSWQAVADKILKLEDEMAAGAVTKPGRPDTVEAWYTHWLDVIAPVSGRGGRPLDPNTIAGYRSMLRVWVFPRYGRLPLTAFDTHHLDEIYAAMTHGTDGRRALLPTSILRNHSIIRRGLEVALQRGKVVRNPAALIDNPGSTKARKKKLPDVHVARQIVQAIYGLRRNRARWLVGLTIGPRQGEVLGLRWPYVRWDLEAVDIAWQLQRRAWEHGCADPVACASAKCRTAPCAAGPRWAHGCADEVLCKGKPAYCPRRQREADCVRHPNGCPPLCPPGCTGHAAECPDRRGGGLVFVRPKTVDELDQVDGDDGEDPVHLVALPTALMAELREHELLQAFEREAAGQAWEEHGLVFCQPNGRPIDPGADRAELKAILAQFGITRGGTHLLRHLAATMLIDMGVPIEVVQQVLGHSDIRTTRKYVQVSTGLTRRAAAAMGQAFFGEVPAQGSARILHGRTHRVREARRGRVAQN